VTTLPDIRAFIEALDEPSLLVEQGRVLIANRPARDLLGSGIEGRDVRLAIRHPAALEHILSGLPGDAEVSGIGGAARPWQLSVRSAGGGLLLIRLNDQAAVRAAEKMRVDFVANASHELRTPLATILGYAETLAEGGNLDPALPAKFGETMRGEARRMLRVIEDLMSLSRIEADRFRAPRGRVALAELARTAAERANALADTRQCRVELDLADGLPDVRADQTQLLQVLDNLLANALRYGCSSAGCAVRLSAGATERGVALTVTDFGEGIAREHLPLLTRRFYRVNEARSRDSGGTGLGLAIVKHIVERHRGTLDIQSVPGAGTKVVVTLPAA
jgi:two-component system phosphate regulon sensor histidine kinase PhoR